VWRQRLLTWYERHARTLPWRVGPHASGQDTDPYKVWVSEIMLQQTQVDTVIPYFLRWMERFPNLPALAAASEQEVLAVWEGLGYYSRARNLLKAARIVAAKFGGSLPAEHEILETLPGIGRYTAGAIASIAFKSDEPALDGNIRRVLARLFDVSLPARSPAGERRLWELAAENLPPGRAGDYNQALMDLGAAICTPRSPNCLLCPLSEDCQARANGVQEQRPVTQPRARLPHLTVAAGILEKDGKVLIAQRPPEGLLGGMWEFPGGTQEAGEDLPACLRRELQEELGIGVEVTEGFGIYQHAYTHFKVTLHAFFCRLIAGEPQPLEATELRWAMVSELKNFPMGKIDRQIARNLEKHRP
jgi:A/G-specific adenine glycosylase